MKVSPYDLLINFDVKVRDGSVAGSNYSEVWVRLFEILSKNEGLAQKFDMVRIFEHIAKNSGAKEISQFEAPQASQMPDEDLMKEVQAGNLIPTDQALQEGVL